MTTATEYPIHELAVLFPDMDDAEFASFKLDIRENGLQHPIVLWRGQVIDGRHRLMACQAVGVEPDYIDIGDDVDPRQYVISANLERRMITASQRAGIEVRVREWKPEGRPSSETSETDDAPSTAEMAEEANVSERTITDAKTAERGGLGDAVIAGDISASEAARQVREQEQGDTRLPPPPPEPQDGPTEGQPDEESPEPTEDTPQAGEQGEQDSTVPTPRQVPPPPIVDEQAARIEELESINRLYRDQLGDLPDDKEREFRRLRLEIQNKQASLNTCMAMRRDLEIENNNLHRKIEALQSGVTGKDDFEG